MVLPSRLPLAPGFPRPRLTTHHFWSRDDTVPLVARPPEGRAQLLTFLDNLCPNDSARSEDRPDGFGFFGFGDTALDAARNALLELRFRADKIREELTSVSYTHLTLPTIYSV